MKGREIEKIANDIRRAVGKTYKYKQSDYINWKIKDGYFFCLDAPLMYDRKTYFMHPELSVKPVYMDDMYWKIIYPHREMKLPDSRRGNGQLHYLAERIWKESTPKTLHTEFSAEEFERTMTDIFVKSEREIEAFLQKYPHPDLFGKFMAEDGFSCALSEVLILINEEKFTEAAQFAKERIAKNKGITNFYVIGEGENRREKSEFEFIWEYCQSKIADATE